MFHIHRGERESYRNVHTKGVALPPPKRLPNDTTEREFNDESQKNKECFHEERLLTLWLLRLLSLHSSHVQSKHAHTSHWTSDYATFRRNVFCADKTHRLSSTPRGSQSGIRICERVYNMSTHRVYHTNPSTALPSPTRPEDFIKDGVKVVYSSTSSSWPVFGLQHCAVALR